jgi:uncharacterized membrane protein
MASCPRCGSAVSGSAAYCSVCGSPVSSARTFPSAVPPPTGTSGAGMSSAVAGAFSYLLWVITGIILLCVEPYRRDPFVRFHAFQSICFHAVITVLWIVWNNVVWLGFLSLGFLLVFINLVGALVTLGIVFYWIFLMYKAYNGERYMIPVIGEFASKLASKES